MQSETFHGFDIGEVEAKIDDFSVGRVILDVTYYHTSGGWAADVIYIDIF